ncbi:MAG TPA: hypothetical protein VJ965_01400 [Anaerolineales bacterium]|nr:hypothetical protein [Anaerolineales bacterium]
MNIGHAITGLLMSLFGYTIIFALALVGRPYFPEYLNVFVYQSQLIAMGMNFYLIDVIVGAIGGILGGDISEKYGSAVGGSIAGILTGIVMIGILVSR